MNAFDTQTTMIKVALVDDHQLLLDGISLLLKDAENIEIALTAKNGKQLIAALKEHEVDIIVLDINMPEMDGVETIKVLKKEFPAVSTLILSTLDDTKLIRKMLLVEQFLMKRCKRATASSKEIGCHCWYIVLYSAS